MDNGSNSSKSTPVNASNDGTPAGSFFVVGGAGFIGSHFCDTLLAQAGVTKVTAYDNLCSGSVSRVAHHQSDTRFELIVADIENRELLTKSMAGHDVVIHLASNPDIARAVTEPSIDFDAGTILTHYVVEAMRESGVSRLLYASGSGIYGDLGELEVAEDYGPLIPISTYAASKIAGEALISAYCVMFGITARVFRFGNVVGPRQTHGVGYDFVRSLKKDSTTLRILGDGTQSKSYIYVNDVVNAVLMANTATKEDFRAYNVATGDYISVTEIADIALSVLGLDTSTTKYEYTGGDRGWKGDVPVMRLNTDRIKSLGWKCERGVREAIRASLVAMAEEVESLA